MTIEDLGNLGEFVSGIAVVLSLIYLAVQVRRNTQQLRNNERALLRAESSAQHEQYSGWRQMQINDPSLISVWDRGLNGDELDLVERRQFNMLATELFYVLSNVLDRYEAGVAPEGAWEVALKSIESVVRSPGGAIWWENQKSWFYPHFVEAIDEALGT